MKTAKQVFSQYVRNLKAESKLDKQIEAQRDSGKRLTLKQIESSKRLGLSQSKLQNELEEVVGMKDVPSKGPEYDALFNRLNELDCNEYFDYAWLLNDGTWC